MRYLCMLLCICLITSIAVQARDSEIDYIIDSKTVCPLGYGGWLEGVPQQRYEEAKEWGEGFAENNFIVNCSAPKGPLRTLANTAKNMGAVVPEKFTPRYDIGVKDQGDFSKRERQLLDRQRFFKSNVEILSQSAVFVALPGGIGCLSVVLDILAMNEEKIFNRPLYFYNEAYWKPILNSLEQLCPLPPYTIINKPEQFFATIQEHQSGSHFIESSWKQVKAYYDKKQVRLNNTNDIHYSAPLSLSQLSNFFRDYALKMIDAFKGSLILDHYIDEEDWVSPIASILNNMHNAGVLPEESKSLYKIAFYLQPKTFCGALDVNIPPQ